MIETHCFFWGSFNQSQYMSLWGDTSCFLNSYIVFLVCACLPWAFSFLSSSLLFSLSSLFFFLLLLSFVCYFVLFPFSSVAMAVLVQGGPQTWGLSSKPAANNNQTQNNKKNVVLVKLTDSSLRALEEYLKNPVSKPKKEPQFASSQMERFFFSFSSELCLSVC